MKVLESLRKRECYRVDKNNCVGQECTYKRERLKKNTMIDDKKALLYQSKYFAPQDIVEIDDLLKEAVDINNNLMSETAGEYNLFSSQNLFERLY
jgi:hypothetical protein